MFNFFKKFPLGLDISDFSIEALELERRLGKLYLGAYSRVTLQKGIVEDGKILNKEKVKEKVLELLANSQPRGFKTKQVILSLPESKTFFDIFELPANLQGQELYKAVEKEAEKTIPLVPEELYFDFKLISERKEIKEVLYVGTPKEIVDGYLETLRGVGLVPLALDIESASLARAFKSKIEKNRGTLIVDIGAGSTILTIFDKGSVRFSATVPVAGDNLTQALSEKLEISFIKAEELKKRCGFDPEKEEGRILFVLQQAIQPILNEIKKSINFYEKREGKKVKKILLCGGSSFMPKISSYIFSNLNIETLVPDPWEGINVDILFKKKELREIIETRLHPVFFANVIGLAKRGLEKSPETSGINLISNLSGAKARF